MAAHVSEFESGVDTPPPHTPNPPSILRPSLSKLSLSQAKHERKSELLITFTSSFDPRRRSNGLRINAAEGSAL